MELTARRRLGEARLEPARCRCHPSLLLDPLRDAATAHKAYIFARMFGLKGKSPWRARNRQVTLQFFLSSPGNLSFAVASPAALTSNLNENALAVAGDAGG